MLDVQNESQEAVPEETGAGTLRMMIPKGRIQDKVLALLGQIGIKISFDERSYKPRCSEQRIEAKILKSQNIPSLVSLARHDCGFAGKDWIIEQNADVIELVDLKFDPVRIVAAVPEALAAEGRASWSKRRLVVASEYRNLALQYIERNQLQAYFIQTFGATEALPPDDADLIIDNTASGSTLKANKLVIVDELMNSTTRFICSKEALKDPEKGKRLEELRMLMESALRAKEKVLLEMNVSSQDFERLVKDLPCMKSPTVSELYNGDGYAIKIAVNSSEVSKLIPLLMSRGARDILEYKLEKIVY